MSRRCSACREAGIMAMAGFSPPPTRLDLLAFRIVGGWRPPPLGVRAVAAGQSPERASSTSRITPCPKPYSAPITSPSMSCFWVTGTSCSTTRRTCPRTSPSPHDPPLAHRRRAPSRVGRPESGALYRDGPSRPSGRRCRPSLRIPLNAPLVGAPPNLLQREHLVAPGPAAVPWGARRDLERAHVGRDVHACEYR